MALLVSAIKLLVLCHLFFCCGVHVYSLPATEPLLRPLCPPSPARCTDERSARNEHFYYVEGERFVIQFQDGKHFELTCSENVTLENESLPRFDRPVYVEKVILRICAPPSTSFAKALAALNVHVLEWLHIDQGQFSVETPLEARHLNTLPPTVWKLTISASDIECVECFPLSGNFTFNPSITDLRLSFLTIPSSVLYNLPLNLRTLHFMNSGLETIPTLALARLKVLERIYLQDRNRKMTTTPDFSVAPMLREVFILASLHELSSLSQFENVSLWNVHTLGSNVFGDCPRLKMLSLGYIELESLPVSYLANCSQLKQLEVISSDFSSLPSRLLAGASALESMTVRHCNRLTTLPADLFTNTTHLSTLDMSFNKLNSLPSGVFAPLRQLRVLDLSNNQLTALWVRPALEALPALRELRLANNPLGDLCDVASSRIAVNGVSSLSHMTSLKSLDLQSTDATQMCRDWSSLCNLADINLEDNNITVLQYENVRFTCAASVNLRGAPIRTIAYSYKDYLDVLNSPHQQTSVATIEVNAPLECDCRSYWFARALLARPTHVAFPGLRCRDKIGADQNLDPDTYFDPDEDPDAANGRPFVSVPPEEMTCETTSLECAKNCSCFVWPQSESNAVTRAVCENASLTSIPRLPTGTPPLSELLVPGNHIATLNAEDIPDALTLLDLSNNSLSRVSGAAASALLPADRVRRLRLAGNPLACDCDGRPFLAALQAHQDRVLDYDNVTCSDRQLVREVVVGALCGSRAGLRAGVAVASVAVLLAVLVALALRFRPQLAARVKEELLRRGLCVRWALRPPTCDRDDGDEDKPYDVFISFAHVDNRFVTDCLLPRLEAYRYRVCVHFRDFRPGELITSQIESSVRNSRRTVVVLTENFAASSWGKAEFKLAHAFSVRDSRPRLVVIVLGSKNPEDMDLDQDWKDYIKTNTYLRCDDPWFWQRLKIAIGKPRLNSTSSITAML